jgi:hypothetical protein
VVCKSQSLLVLDSDTSPSWWGDGELLMAIDLGFDESGNEDVLLVTFQLSRTQHARNLQRKWRKRLGPSLSYFHSSEFTNYSGGVFDGMNRAQRESLLNGLSQMARQHISIGMTAKVTKSVYDKKTNDEFRSKWGTAYTFSIMLLFYCAYSFAKHLNYEPSFNVLIEGGHRHSPQAVQFLNSMKNSGFNPEMSDCKLLSVGLGAKSDHGILQAADMLAYSEWQKMRGGDMSIYGAMHSPALQFEPEIFDFDEEMVDIIVGNVHEWVAKRKAWGRRKPLSKAGGV